MREKRGFGPWGWLLLIFGLLVFFSNGGFFADGTNIISPAVAERLNVDQSIILTMNSVAGIVGVLIAVAAGQAASFWRAWAISRPATPSMSPCT